MPRLGIPRKTRLVSATIVVRPARLITLVLMAATFVPAPGCVEVDGGAIEASWVLRTFDGRAISGCDCANPEIARVRLVVHSALPDPASGSESLGPDVCAGLPGCEFSCRSQRGATPFFLPTGRYAISVLPLGSQGEALVGAPSGMAGVRVPAPILRDVEFGRPTQLDAVAIESGCAQICNGDQSNKVCSRN